MTARRGFGNLRKLPSGRWQASYVGPDGQRHNAPATFGTKTDAGGWLAAQQTDIARGTWGKPAPARREACPGSPPTPPRGWRPGRCAAGPSASTARSCTGT